MGSEKTGDGYASSRHLGRGWAIGVERWRWFWGVWADGVSCSLSLFIITFQATWGSVSEMTFLEVVQTISRPMCLSPPSSNCLTISSS